MSPLKCRPLHVRRIECLVLASACVVFVGVTAAQGGEAVNVPLPGSGTVIESLGLLAIGEMLRRVLDRLKDVAEKCEDTASEFSAFKSRIETGLLGLNGNGGALSTLDELHDRVESIEKRLPGLGPRDVGTLDRRHQ